MFPVLNVIMFVVMVVVLASLLILATIHLIQDIKNNNEKTVDKL